ncbi:tRNA -methyltransferase catalytic subunit trm61 [Golovinomyces cichoracearum]|uniref:tRNA (adenine(58)-N(1))-methyltransferase catalytic subunit TRM61 n=1 Tax=Golovinomyces cichoracearum TaxID=62708 RepID=A0A420HYR2_9PEZI|nr:tRNA -methyltransferase catalytic subunit trm61 [Golovinomyces cichoracearum]
MTHRTSPFLFPGTEATADKLSIIHLKRDHQIPVILREHDEDDEGYAEGKVVNTRFGNFPHRTLIGLPWGSQVRASKVDTGSRGRRVKADALKRKRESVGTTNYSSKNIKTESTHDEELENPKSPSSAREEKENQKSPIVTKEEKESVVASSGFIHLLPPTPENWTSSLPHRTQVVYTPDYSYILHQLRARPGTRLIEAGAGSGSFTHASARAVFNGYPRLNDSSKNGSEFGKIWSFEFHEQRYEKLQVEVKDHGLENIVQVLHRDVCTDGFLIHEQTQPSSVGSEHKLDNTQTESKVCTTDCKKSQQTQKSPMASAVFLDLPAPWLALPHLTRSAPAKSTLNQLPFTSQPSLSNTLPFISALDPSAPAHICTFSPCIEQVQRTVSVMRRLGWVDINVTEISHKRLEVRRERIGLSATGAQRGLQMIPANVEEAVSRLLEVEGTNKAYHEKGTDPVSDEKPSNQEESAIGVSEEKKESKKNCNRREKILEDLVENKSYKDGRLVHRTETEVKTHTSYLVFAVLPQQWEESDELLAREKWPLASERGENKTSVDVKKQMSRKTMKKLARMSHKESQAELQEMAENQTEKIQTGHDACLSSHPDS